MKRLAAVLLLALTSIIAAPAVSQALPAATGPGSSVVIGGGLSGFNTDYGQHRIAGGVVFLDLHPHWRYGLEGEARFLRWHTDQQVTEATYLGGLHVIVSPHPGLWQPYVKLLAGTGHITLPYGYAHGSFLAYAGAGGLDLNLNDRLAIRALEIEYQRWPQFPYGALAPYGLTTGISLRLNSVKRFPHGNTHRH